MKIFSLIVFFIAISSIAGMAFSVKKSHLKVAEKVVKVAFNQEKMQKIVKAQIEKLIKTHSELIGYEDVIYNFSDKYYNYKNFSKPLTKLYANVFTENELNELLIIYNSQVREKLLEKMPYLTNEAQLIAAGIFETHKKEFEVMMDEQKKILCEK